MHVDLPREAHAAEHLRRRLAVGDRGVAGDDLGAVDEPVSGVRIRPLVEDRARAVDGGARHLGAREHVGEHVLDRLERADRPVELHPLLRVGDRELGQPVGEPELQRGGERGARGSRLKPVKSIRGPSGTRSARDTGVHGSSGHGDGSASTALGSTA